MFRMSLDCGKKPGVVAIDGMRRCRVLINHPSLIPLDLRLLSQVEVLYIPCSDIELIMSS